MSPDAHVNRPARNSHGKSKAKGEWRAETRDRRSLGGKRKTDRVAKAERHARIAQIDRPTDKFTRKKGKPQTLSS